jgi:hypothetical protein
MVPAAWFVLVPLAHASLLSGIAISLGTPWGLLRYHWVVAKLAITLIATVIRVGASVPQIGDGRREDRIHLGLCTRSHRRGRHHCILMLHLFGGGMQH